MDEEDTPPDKPVPSKAVLPAPERQGNEDDQDEEKGKEKREEREKEKGTKKTEEDGGGWNKVGGKKKTKNQPNYGYGGTRKDGNDRHPSPSSTHQRRAPRQQHHHHQRYQQKQQPQFQHQSARGLDPHTATATALIAPHHSHAGSRTLASELKDAGGNNENVRGHERKKSGCIVMENRGPLASTTNVDASATPTTATAAAATPTAAAAVAATTTAKKPEKECVECANRENCFYCGLRDSGRCVTCSRFFCEKCYKESHKLFQRQHDKHKYTKYGEVSKAAGYCEDCVEFYCDDCFQLLHRTGKRKLHILVQGNEIVPKKTTKLMEILTDNLKMYQRLGGGSNGEVFRGVWKDENGVEREVAIKAPKKKEENIRKEAAIMTSLHHVNVIECYGICISNSGPYLVLEYAADGSLHEAIHYSDKEKVASKALNWVHQISCGMEYLHSGSSDMVMHGDLKPGNILLHGETLKIADFGLSHNVQFALKNTNMFGTVCYMAPEIICGQVVPITNHLVDVWSFGVIVYEIATCEIPFREYTPVQILTLVGSLYANGDNNNDNTSSNPQQMQQFPFKLDEQYPPHWRYLLQKCLQVRPEERFSFRMIRQFVGNVVDGSWNDFIQTKIDYRNVVNEYQKRMDDELLQRDKEAKEFALLELKCQKNGAEFTTNSTGLELEIEFAERRGKLPWITSVIVKRKLCDDCFFNSKKTESEPTPHNATNKFYWMPFFIGTKLRQFEEDQLEEARLFFKAVFYGKWQFDPELQRFPKLRDEQEIQIALQVMKNLIVGIAGDDKAPFGGMEILCCTTLHRYLLKFSSEAPIAVNKYLDVVNKFVENDEHRKKRYVKDLLVLLLQLTVLDVSGTSWNDVKYMFLEESIIRNQKWLLKRSSQSIRQFRSTLPESQQLYPIYVKLWVESLKDEELVDIYWNSAQIGMRSIMFGSFFLLNVAHPHGKTLNEVDAMYDQCYGCPPADVRNWWKQAWRQITRSINANSNNNNHINHNGSSSSLYGNAYYSTASSSSYSTLNSSSSLNFLSPPATPSIRSSGPPSIASGSPSANNSHTSLASLSSTLSTLTSISSLDLMLTPQYAYTEYFRLLNVPVPSIPELAQMVRQSITISEERKYHVEQDILEDAPHSQSHRQNHSQYRSRDRTNNRLSYSSPSQQRHGQQHRSTP